MFKLKKFIDNCYTFDQSIKCLQKFVYESRYSRCGTATSEHSERKYFPKTPQNNVIINKSRFDAK